MLQIPGHHGQPPLDRRRAFDRSETPQTHRGVAVVQGHESNRMKGPGVLDDDTLDEHRPAVGPPPQILRLEHRRTPFHGVLRHALDNEIEIHLISEYEVRHQSATPTTPTKENATRRRRGRRSHSTTTICCQVPRTHRPADTGTVNDGPSSAALRWEKPLPSPHR